MRATMQALPRPLAWLPPAAAVLLMAHSGVAHGEPEMEFEPDDLGDEVSDPADEPADEPRPEPPADTSPPSETLERATSMYDEGRYFPASIELHRVIAGQTDDSEANLHRAEFFLGKTLYHLGFYASALSQFDDIVELGYGHRYFPATLPWLAALSRVLPESSGVLDLIGAYDPSDLEDPIMDDVRDELYYLLGRHAYEQGDFTAAIDLFRRVSEQDPFHLRAKFFEAVTHVRQFDGEPAVEAFQDLLVLNEEEPDHFDRSQIRRFGELARLQLARIFYSTQQFDTSIRYYEELPQDSPDWLDAVFEASWAHFMRGQNSHALGNIHTLTAPYFEDQFYPESIILRSVIFYNYCLYDRALESVEEFNAIYMPLREEVEQVLEEHPDDADLFDFVLDLRNGNSGLPEETASLLRSAVDDRRAQTAFQWVVEIEDELERLQAADDGWADTDVGGEVLGELTFNESFARAEAGGLARERLERLEDQLREHGSDALRVRIEVLEALAGEISADARDEQITGDHEPEPIDVDDEHVMWNFDGEYWRDELGHYRYRIRSECPGEGRLQ